MRNVFTLRIRVFVLGILTMLGLANATNAAHVKVVLMGGQSNMAGRADKDDLPDELKGPQDDVLFYHKGNASLTTLRPGSGGDFGPEVTFGKTIAAARPSDNFALIKHADGGTSLFGDWEPTTGATYSGFRDTVKDGLAALTDAGHTYEIVGMLWTQGERDAKAGRTTEQYQADLDAFIGDIRGRYGEDLPFFLSRLSSGQTNIPANELAQIRAAQDGVAAGDAHAYLIDTDKFNLKPDDLHFDSDGQIKLGEAFGQAYVDVVSAPEPASMFVFAVAGALIMTRRR